MLVLGIESTCDETGCAIVRCGKDILSNVIASQVDLHRKFGGVVPELACRRHIDAFIPVLEEAMHKADVSLPELGLIAVAHGPGLIGALLIGLNAAKALSFALKKPLIGVNHVEAHLYASLMSASQEVVFPCLGVVLSGGHTAIILIKDVGVYQLIGQTIDDAIGEAFDKAAKILDLPYPGGPEIEALAKAGDRYCYPFKAGQIKGKPYDFSFSGLKTAVLYTARGQLGKGEIHPSLNRADIAASFQEAALQDVLRKTKMAAELFNIKTIVFGGGVTNNKRLRMIFAQDSDLKCLWPAQGLDLDNAAMIAGLGYHRYSAFGQSDSLSLEPMIRIPFSKF